MSNGLLSSALNGLDPTSGEEISGLDANGKEKSYGSMKEIEQILYAKESELRDDFNAHLENFGLEIDERGQFAARKGKAANSRAGKRWRTKNKEKTSAHSKVFNAIRCGELVRSNVCERCDSVGVTEATHTDYSKPLDVEWLCYSCHRIKVGIAVD